MFLLITIPLNLDYLGNTDTKFLSFVSHSSLLRIRFAQGFFTSIRNIIVLFGEKFPSSGVMKPSVLVC